MTVEMTRVQQRPASRRRRCRRESITARVRGTLAFLTTMAATVCSPHIAAATDILLTSTEDTLDSRECSLRAAVAASNTQVATAACRAGSGNDTIILTPATTYTLTQVGDGSDDPSGLAVTGTLTIAGNGATIERSSAAGTPAFRVFWVAPAATLVLNDVTIANGKTPDSAWGGGVSNAGTLTLANSTVIASVGSRAGGGIFNSGTLTVLNSAILLNTTGDSILAANGTRILGGDGGGVFNAGTATVINSVVSDNATGTGGDGGGTYNSGTLRLVGSLVRGNRTGPGLASELFAGVGGSGGGIKNAYTGTLTLSNSRVSGNLTGTGGVAGDRGFGGLGGKGGGIANDGMLAVTASTISDNLTGDGGAGGLGGDGGDGGGIANTDTATVVSSTVSGNVTGDGGASGVGVGSGSGGGGGGIFNPLSGTLTVVNSTVSGNGTGSGGCCGGFDSGGGIANAGTFSLASSTISENTAGPNRGGGIANFSSGTLIAENTIIAGNSAASDPDCTGILTSEGYNLVGDVAGCPLAGGSGDVIGQDPFLGPLQDNGGPTFTQALLAGSPAIDAGDPAGCTNANGALLTRDQRGAARARAGDTRCDIGSYEFGATVLPPCVGDCNQDGMVTVDEILVGVNIALGGEPSATCPALTTNRNDTVTIDEILQAVNSALHGCS
jgi:hypothetical protein